MSTADADQIEQLRRLWDQYGRLLSVAVVAVLLGVFGKYFYDSYQQRQAVGAAALYAAYQQPPAGQTADAIAQQLRAKYPRTSYATFAALAQARQAVEAGKLDSAAQHLRWVVSNAGEPTDRALARLRLARVLLDQGKAQAAQDALGKDIPATSPALSEIRGDIARAQDKPQEARQAYQEALAGLPPESGQAAILKLKLDALGQP
jgi:predicted negative regulator of RcsB-dependent stress response